EVFLLFSLSISFTTSKVTSKVASKVTSKAASKVASKVTSKDSLTKSVSTVDKFLLSIYNKIIILTKDNTLLLTDYSIVFKVSKETDADTQLADAYDFIKFKTEYL
ncbi:10220_t:CDS:2, partial [Scutellospora calospora]